MSRMESQKQYTERWLAQLPTTSMNVVEERRVLPEDAKQRKDIPLWSGTVGYFPYSFVLMAQVSKDGNDQHNPGKPLHWDRTKSLDHMDSAFRHLHDSLSLKGHDRLYVLAQAMWRLGAEIQTGYEELEDGRGCIMKED